MEEQLKAIQGAISDIENKVHSIFITPKCFAEEIVEMNRIYSELSNVLQEVVNETMTIPSKFLMQKILVIEFIGIINDVVKFNTQRYKTMSTFRQGALSELLKGDLQKSLSRISESITTKFEDDPAAQIPPEKRGYVEVPLDYKDHYLSQTKKYSFNKENSVVNQIQFSSLEGGSSRRVRCVAKSHNLHGSSASFSFSLSPSSQSSSSSSVKEKLDNSPLLRSPGSTKSGLTVSSPVIVASEEDTNEKEEKKAQARPSKKEKKEKVKKDKKEGLAKIKAPIFSFSKGRPRSLGNKDEFQEDISKAVAGAAAAAAAIQPPLPTATSGSAANAFDSPHSARCESSDSPAAPLSREQVVNELLSTEKAYVDGLKILISAYKAPLHQDGHIITSADSDAIFGNLEVIYNLHEKLLKSLEKDPAGDSIGKTLLPYTQFFKSYIDYGKTFEKGSSLLHKLKKSNPEFRKFLEKVGKQHNSQQPLDHLDNLLATPIQRLPWYNVLLNDLIGCTDKEHPDYGNITKARDLMAQVSDKILKSVKVGESQNKLLTIQLSFSDTDRCNGLVSRSKPLVQPHREFVLEADFVTKDGKKGESSVHIILCNDVIIFTKKKRLSSVLTFVLCEPIGICSASKCESSKSDFSIQWGTATEEEEGYVLLEASSEEERDMWANKVNELSEKINAQIKDKIMRVVSLNTTEDEATIKAEEVFNQEVHFENMSIFDSIVIEVSDEIIEMEF